MSRSRTLAVVSGLAASLLLGACSGEETPVGAASEGSGRPTTPLGPTAGPAVPGDPEGTAAPSLPAGVETTSTVEASVPAAALSQTPAPPPGGAGDLAPVETTDRVTLPPVAIEQPAELGTGLQVRLAGIEAVEVTGRGPGQLSGPGVAVTVEVENAGAAPLDVAGLAVSLAYAGTEAGPVEGPPADPVLGAVPARSTVSGTYVFLVPVQERDDVVISVGLASQPVAVFTGSATD